MQSGGFVSYRPELPKADLLKKVKGWSRPSGRKARQFRPAFMRVGVVSQAVGSAYIEAGSTKVVVAIYGPRQTERLEYSERGRLKVDLRYSAVCCPDPERHRRSSEEKDASQSVHTSLEASIRLDKYPKSVIDVVIFVLDADGGVMPLAITCASLALAHAGVEQYGLVAACSAVKLPLDTASADDCIVLDPTEEEEEMQQAAVTQRDSRGSDTGSAAGTLTLAYMPMLSLVTQISQSGEMGVDGALTDMVTLCTDGCVEIHSQMKECLLAHAHDALEQSA